ncbi:MAG: hypothetical protein D6685_02580 [Bacteroidetes bacterium]|nr:MAG: hypothetical protein D6685_02580 [Bacteroidota bacterium]
MAFAGAFFAAFRPSRRLPVLACLLLLIPAAGHAQQVEVYLSADSVTVGERFYLSLVAEHAMLQEPAFPEPTIDDSLFGDLEVIRRVTQQHRYLGAARPGTRVDSVVYEVTTFALDTAYVPPIPVRFSMNEDTVLVAAPPAFVPVISLVPPDAEGIQDLAPLAAFPRPLWPWVLLALGLLIGAALLWAYLRRRRRAGPPAEVQPPEPEVSPYEEAMDRLRRLETWDLADEAAVKPFYVELSDVLRRYLERRLGVAALEMTTRELVERLRREAVRSEVPDEVAALVKRVLDVADLAKFADVHPPPAEGFRAVSATHQVLQAVETALRPAMPSAPAGDGAPADPGSLAGVSS